MIAKFVKEIVVEDPDTGGDVNVSIYKHQNGGLFGIDSSYIAQNFDDDTFDPLIPDLFSDTNKVTVVCLID